MPYKRSYRKRTPRRYKKRSLYTARNAMTVANDALYLGKKLARMVNVEYKRHEYVISSTAIDNNGKVYPLISSDGTINNSIVQGDLNTQRSGSSIKPINLTFRMSVFNDPSAGAQASRIRIILCRS